MTSPTITIRTRLAGALAAVLVIAAIAIGMTSQPVAAAAITVRQGDTVVVGSTSGAAPFVLSPLEAGTVSNPSWVGEATFTASTTFLGPATLCITGQTCVDVIVVGNTAAAQGSFVPVAAPGPCLLITANPVVPFGNVTVGGVYKDTPAPPNVFGCAPASVTQDILVQATNAQNGVINLAVDSCSQVAGCAPGEGTYSVAILDAPLIVRSTPTLWLDARAGNAGAAPQLAVKMPATLAPTFVGSLFTFDVTFTAVID